MKGKVLYKLKKRKKDLDWDFGKVSQREQPGSEGAVDVLGDGGSWVPQNMLCTNTLLLLYTRLRMM